MTIRLYRHCYARPLSSVEERVTSTSRGLRIPVRDMTRSVVRSSQWAIIFLKNMNWNALNYKGTRGFMCRGFARLAQW